MVRLLGLVVLTGAVVAAVAAHRRLDRRASVRSRPRLALALLMAPLIAALVVAAVAVLPGDALPPPSDLAVSAGALALNRPGSSSTDPTVAPPTTPPPPPAPLGPILLMGDSMARSFEEPLAAVGAARGVPVYSATRPGCSMVDGVPAWPNGAPISFTRPCLDDLIPYETDAAYRAGARTVVWMGSWENTNRYVDGRYVRFNTPEGDETLVQLIDEARVRIVGTTGARLIIVLLPAASWTVRFGFPDPAGIERDLHLADLYRWYAAAHPGEVGLVDLGAITCPDGPICPDTLDGVLLHPSDGGHFGDEGAAWVAPRLLDAIDVAARQLPPPGF